MQIIEKIVLQRKEKQPKNIYSFSIIIFKINKSIEVSSDNHE